MAPPSGARPTDCEDGLGLISPVEIPFSAYVFKLQANMKSIVTAPRFFESAPGGLSGIWWSNITD